MAWVTDYNGRSKAAGSQPGGKGTLNTIPAQPPPPPFMLSIVAVKASAWSCHGASFFHASSHACSNLGKPYMLEQDD
ncbi:hypothetical protein GGP41_003811 [Bipolaris sorokiniana]|uniref:Uncharacterized protein n=1 Tax=Cochliobolus sativus TaxID=45130 RepID=A0A8H5ZBT2_COCSA|nr:hypothetical protein GGP41_003811 [Bipolaris sorokiniana]